MADFKEMIQKERERLNGLRQEAMTRRSAVDDEIADIDKELRAITAYETARTGTTITKATGTRGDRRSGILTLLAAFPDGLSRADILDKLGMKGNKAGEQSISNALSVLKKQGKIGQKNGKYAAA
jgi:hypothetical protein